MQEYLGLKTDLFMYHHLYLNMSEQWFKPIVKDTILKWVKKNKIKLYVMKKMNIAKLWTCNFQHDLVLLQTCFEWSYWLIYLTLIMPNF